MRSILDEIKAIVPKQDPIGFSAYLTELENYASDSEFEDDRGSVKEFYRLLVNLSKQYPRQLQNSNGGVTLDKLLLRFKWLALSGLDRKTKEQIFSDRVIEAIKNKIDILSCLDSYLAFFEFGEELDTEERQMFINSLTHNQETLGTQSITLKSGDIVRGLVSNWLKDYISYTDPNVPRGASYELTQYLYSSPNAKKLVVADREMLAQIINIYNFLRYPQNVPKKLFTKSSQGPGSLPREVVKPVIAPKIEPVAPKPAPKPTPPPPPPKYEPTSFEQRLAEASESSGQHGVDLQVLRRQMEKTREEGGGKRAEQKVEEIKREIKTPELIAPKREVTVSPPLPNKYTEEIKREVATPELPAHLTKPKPLEAPKPVVLAPKNITHPALDAGSRQDPRFRGDGLSKPTPKPAAVPVKPEEVKKPKPTFRPTVNAGPPLLFSLDKIQSVDDLTKVELANLRQGQPASQIQTIKSKVISLVKENEILPYYVISAFEESPLYKAYLAHGKAMVSGEETADMSQSEFEAIADLKKQLEQL